MPEQRIPGHLTLEEGLAIQREQLADWKPKLSEACYLALATEAKLQNYAMQLTPRQGFDVWRGTDMNNFIANWTPKQ